MREAVGSLICKLGANLHRSSSEGQARMISLGHSRVQDWDSVLLKNARSATETIQTKGLDLEISPTKNTSGDTPKQALKRIETVP